MIPDIENSTKEEREEYIRNRFRCISDCESGIDSVKNRCSGAKRRTLYAEHS